MKISNETKVGALSAIAIVLLILGYSYLKGNKLFTKGRIFHVKYESISGLTTSDDVIMRGFEIGKISNVELMRDSTVWIKVSIIVYENIDIPEDSEARIVNADLLGDKAVELNIGKSDKMAASGDWLIGSMETSLSQQIEQELLPVKEKIEVLVSNIDSVITRVQAIFDMDFEGRVNEGMKSVEAAILNIRNITKRVDDLLAIEAEKINQVMSNINSITENLKENRENINKTLAGLGSFSDSLAKVNIIQTMASIDKVSADLAYITDQIKNGNNNLSLLISDRKLYDNLEATTKKLNQLVEDLKKNPRKYVPPIIQIGGRK